ncbi:MAG: hypothetical protein ACI8Y4_000299 [Candidatus Poriferisodalaceae bacterium]|jgi:hypothetical protein
MRSVRWSQFSEAAPEIATRGRHLLYQFGLGLGFVSTVRADGGPRLHPFCPILSGEGLYGFMVPGPKQRDLDRDGRVAIHSYPPEDTDDEFCVTGSAVRIDDATIRARVDGDYQVDVADDHLLYEYLIARVMLATYEARGVFPPAYDIWSAAETA